uniref:Uncharacterized protein n=1 Tax=Caenorhabditis japonica TaxID=281687 RepID=A0A8R1IQX5_CAEJA
MFNQFASCCNFDEIMTNVNTNHYVSVKNVILSVPKKKTHQRLRPSLPSREECLIFFLHLQTHYFAEWFGSSRHTHTNTASGGIAAPTDTGAREQFTPHLQSGTVQVCLTENEHLSPNII